MKSYLYGMKRSIPVFFGFLPVAITFAIMAMSTGMTGVETVAMSVFVFAGASQIMAVGMLGASASMLSIVLATFVLNLRHVIMSTCIFTKVRIKNPLHKLIAALSVTDEGFALITTEREERCNPAYLFGVATLTYLSWIVGTVLGVLANNILPTIVADSFGIALYALFIALVMPDIKKSLRLLLTVLITIGINCVLTVLLPSSWAIIVSTLAGALVGTFIVEDKEDAAA